MSFKAYEAKKTADAIASRPPGFATEYDRAPAGLVAIGNAWTRQLFDGAFYLSPAPGPTRPACSLVFVQSKDGNTGARNPATLGGGETDLHLIYEGLSRVGADAVMSGAETTRGGGIVFSVWHPELVALRASLGKPRHPVQIVATLRGLDVEHAMLFNVPDLHVVLVTVGTCAQLMRPALASRPWITPVVMQEPTDLAWAFEQLRAMGIERISAVGGRRIAAQMIDAGLVQEVYLTTSPKTGGEPNTPFYPRPLDGEVILRKVGVGNEAGVTFQQTLI